MMNETMGIDGSSSLKVENAKLPEGATDSMLDGDMGNWPWPWLSDPFLLSLQRAALKKVAAQTDLML
jgi:hypothetical protein